MSSGEPSSSPGAGNDPGGAPWSEQERDAALAAYAILDTPAEPDFDDLVQLATETFGAPIAVINLVAGDRQWFKAERGIGARELTLDVGGLPLELSICAHVLSGGNTIVVPDLRADERFAANPLVQAPDGLRFYAGALLRSPAGLPIGTFCVLDRVPRPGGITPHQKLVLEVLARQVMTQLELQRALAEQAQRAEAVATMIAQHGRSQLALKEVEQRYHLAGRATNDVVWDWDFTTNHVVWNAALEENHGHKPADVEPTGDWWLAQIHPDDRARIHDSIHAAIDGTTDCWTGEYRFRRADGSYASVLDRGQVIRDADGRATRMIGAMLDMTERHESRAALAISG